MDGFETYTTLPCSMEKQRFKSTLTPTDRQLSCSHRREHSKNHFRMLAKYLQDSNKNKQ